MNSRSSVSIGSGLGVSAAGRRVRVAKYDVKPSGRDHVTRVPDGKMNMSPTSEEERFRADGLVERYIEDIGICTWTT